MASWNACAFAVSPPAAAATCCWKKPDTWVFIVFRSSSGVLVCTSAKIALRSVVALSMASWAVLILALAASTDFWVADDSGAAR